MKRLIVMDVHEMRVEESKEMNDDRLRISPLVTTLPWMRSIDA